MAELPKRMLGNTGLKVTRLGYGTSDLGRGMLRHRAESEKRAETILNAVLDSGINLIDTSIDYVSAEERIGRYISHRRSEYVLATKCGCDANWGPWWRARIPGQHRPHVYSPKNIIAGVEQSLRRLRTDYIDIVAFHHPPPREELERSGAVDALLELKRQGQVRFIASSTRLPEIGGHIAMGVFDIFQVPYSVIHREHEQVLTAIAQSGAGLISRSAFVRGGPFNWAMAPPYIFEVDELKRRWDAAGLDELLTTAGMSSVEFMLRFALSHPDTHATLVGTLNPTHLRADIDILAKGALPDDLLEEAKRRLTAAGSAPVDFE